MQDEAAKEKNQRVLHARIPESLDTELKRRASTLGMSVSNLVRNALHHAFGLVEDVIADSADVARSARGEAAPARAALADVVALAPLVVVRTTPCTNCARNVTAGEQAFAALTPDARVPGVLCPTCKQVIS